MKTARILKNHNLILKADYPRLVKKRQMIYKGIGLYSLINGVYVYGKYPTYSRIILKTNAKQERSL